MSASFTSPDPLASTDQASNPYAYCRSNPVSFWDPSGMRIEDASSEEWNYLKDCVKQNVLGLENYCKILDIARIGRSMSNEEYANQYSIINQRINGLNNFLNGMDRIEKSEQLYSLHNISEGIGGLFYDILEDKITIKYVNADNFVHETTHAIQYENNEIAFLHNGKTIGQDIYDEIEAYQNQYFFNPAPFSPIQSVDQINKTWIQSLTDLDGRQIYVPGKGANTGVNRINIFSTSAEVKKAYGIEFMPHKTIRDIPGIIYKR